MTVEFVIIAPVLIVLMLFLVMAGRVVEALGQADGTARDAARAASIALNQATAQQLAQQAVDTDNDNGANGFTCARPDLQGFGADSPAVTVTVRCTVPMGFFDGTWTVTGHAVAPLDPFNART